LPHELHATAGPLTGHFLSHWPRLSVATICPPNPRHRLCLASARIIDERMPTTMPRQWSLRPACHPQHVALVSAIFGHCRHSSSVVSATTPPSSPIGRSHHAVMRIWESSPSTATPRHRFLLHAAAHPTPLLGCLLAFLFLHWAHERHIIERTPRDGYLSRPRYLFS
jgi:hypothetical protein